MLFLWKNFNAFVGSLIFLLDWILASVYEVDLDSFSLRCWEILPLISWQNLRRELICRNGDTYSGEYFADKMHGFGVYRFANGHLYEGAWHEGRRHGLGMYTFRTGETQSGYWENGLLVTTSTHNSLSSIPIAINHSKVLNVVQVREYSPFQLFQFIIWWRIPFIFWW